jgi:hypothetical protein
VREISTIVYLDAGPTIFKPFSHKNQMCCFFPEQNAIERSKHNAIIVGVSMRGNREPTMRISKGGRRKTSGEEDDE